MSRRVTTPLLSAILLLSGLAVAAEWWEKKPYSQWTNKDVQKMMNESPWGRVHTITIMNPMVTGERTFANIGTGDLEREKRNLFHLHFLTAKPIRMAIARQAMLDSKSEAVTAGLQRFIEQSDDRFMVMAMTLSSVPKGVSSERGYLSALMKLSTPALTSNTFLATKSGKRIYLVRYDAPGQDGLGAKFYFPRYMDDGRPFVTADDRELRFETFITLVESGTSSATPGEFETDREDRIWMQFDLRKMVFEGKLEI
jgi:hypothetical protein